MFRYGLRAVLDDAPEIEVVGEAASGRILLEVVAATHPDVVLTDLSMPDVDGAAATRQLLAHHPNVGILILTMHDDDESVLAALRAGARGYLLKGADGPELIRAYSPSPPATPSTAPPSPAASSPSTAEPTSGTPPRSSPN